MIPEDRLRDSPGLNSRVKGKALLAVCGCVCKRVCVQHHHLSLAAGRPGCCYCLFKRFFFLLVWLMIWLQDTHTRGGFASQRASAADNESRLAESTNRADGWQDDCCLFFVFFRDTFGKWSKLWNFFLILCLKKLFLDLFIFLQILFLSLNLLFVPWVFCSKLWPLSLCLCLCNLSKKPDTTMVQ